MTTILLEYGWLIHLYLLLFVGNLVTRLRVENIGLDLRPAICRLLAAAGPAICRPSILCLLLFALYGREIKNVQANLPCTHQSTPQSPASPPIPLYSSLNPPSFLPYPNTSYIANSEIGHKPEIGIKSEMTHGKKSPYWDLFWFKH